MQFSLIEGGNEFDSNWFGVKFARLTEPLTMVLAQAHRRDIKDDGLHQGVGILQIGGRHLFYVGSSNGSVRLCVGFVWLTERA